MMSWIGREGVRIRNEIVGKVGRVEEVAKDDEHDSDATVATA